jgi:hypothetical protein
MSISLYLTLDIFNNFLSLFYHNQTGFIYLQTLSVYNKQSNNVRGVKPTLHRNLLFSLMLGSIPGFFMGKITNIKCFLLLYKVT